VITLASPIRELRIHPAVMRLALAVESITPSPDELPRPHDRHFHTGDCAHQLMHLMEQPFPAGVPRVSIYTKTDGVVAWQTSIDAAPGVNVEVRGTHLGLVVNAAAYRAVAQQLAALKSAVAAAAAA